MGVGKENLEKKAAEIAAIDGYPDLFEKAFPGAGVTPDTIVKAISAYERTLVCDDTAWDRQQAGDADALSVQQKRGQDLFNGKAACVACHAPPHFSTAYSVPGGVYFNAGIGTNDRPEEAVDVGRMVVTNAATDWAAFKPPSLRNVTKSAPYFHDGSAATLDEAVRVMVAGGFANKNLTPLMFGRDLGDAEIADLVAFLGALDCGRSLEQPDLP
jgi:cytochrome c peroxidase